MKLLLLEYKLHFLQFSFNYIFFYYLEAVTCPPLNIPPKAILLNTSCGNMDGSNCIFGCQSGYGSLSGNVSRTCLHTENWSRETINCTGTETSIYQLFSYVMNIHLIKDQPNRLLQDWIILSTREINMRSANVSKTNYIIDSI